MILSLVEVLYYKNDEDLYVSVNIVHPTVNALTKCVTYHLFLLLSCSGVVINVVKQ